MSNSKDSHFTSDTAFLDLFPTSIQSYNKDHFTPIEVAKKAAAFLSLDNNKKIVDIGSGIGKFCLTAAQLFPNCEFYGIEQRLALHEVAVNIKEKLQLQNVHFIHGNMDHENFKKYDHFYFFNSFHEQLEESEKMNNEVNHDEHLYHYYNRYFFKQLSAMPSGTKLACFFTLAEEIPSSYMLVEEHFDGKLMCYQKI